VDHFLLFVSYKNIASAPEGQPPHFTVTATSTEVRVLEGDEAKAPEWITYATEVQMTGETTLREHGTMTLGDDADRLTVATVGEGLFLPTPQEGIMQGTVMWRVEAGEGRFAGATGVLTGNFTHSMSASAGREFQILNLFIP
jgi:hypothetical protein